MDADPNTMIHALVAGFAGFSAGWFFSVRLSGLPDKVRQLEALRDKERAETERDSAGSAVR